jgi:tetratricopeptide (TPR) repeat protein
MVRNQVFDTVVSCLMSLRRPREAVAMFAARNAMLWDDEDWNTASVGYRTQAVLQFQAGNLADADHAAEKALTAARHLESPRLEVAALAQQAWLSHLRGNIEAAGEMFRQAAALQQQTNPEQPDLFSQDRIWYADHLREADQPDEARAMTQANLALCAQHGWVKSLSQCHRLLGDLDAAAGEHDAAYSHYDEALRIARNIDHRPTLAETLLARGRQAIQQEAYREARTDLNEALGYTLEGGYRIAEAEIRMALALLERAMDDPTAAQAQERYARYLSAATGYRLLERAV